MSNPEYDKLRAQYRAENKKHLKAFLSLLPREYQKKADTSGTRIRIMGVEIKMTHEGGMHWGSSPRRCNRLKIELDYSVRSMVGEDKFRRSRTYKRLDNKGGNYSYDKAAAYVQKVLDAYIAVKKRRVAGKNKAEKVGEQFEGLFKADPILGALNLDVRSKPVHNTECGEATVIFAERNDGQTYRAVEFQTTGDTFRAKLDVHSLTAEQVVALVTVLKVDRLQLLDMFALADDSILGPIIKRMNEQKEDIDAA